MSFILRNQDRLRSAVLWIALMLVIRFGAGLLLGESADNPVSKGTLILLAAIFIPFVLIAVVGVVGLIRNQRDATPTSIAVADHHEWPRRVAILRPEDRDNYRSALVAFGFEHAGTLQVEAETGTSVVAVSLAEDGTSVAVTTAADLTIISDFGGKLLVTNNAATASSTQYRLAQSLPGAGVEELVQAHQQACDVVRSQGGVVTQFAIDDVVQAAARWERYGAEVHSGARETRNFLLALTFPSLTNDSRPRIDDRRSARARVDHWLQQPERWSQA